MKPALSTQPFEQLVADLTPVYGAGEAQSMARIVFEDVFAARQATQKILSETEQTLFSSIRQRLLMGEPLQYVLGQADFFGYKFKVSTAVLIPRQETEELVAWVLEDLQTKHGPAPVVMDIGLGSGCIGLTLKKKRPHIQLFGLEKSPEALAVARENADRLLDPDQEVFFAEGDILDRQQWFTFPNPDLLVSNPPYIPEYERHQVPPHVQAHEPALALFVASEDPLLFYRIIADFALQKLRPAGALFFECNEFNAPAVVDLLHEKGFAQVELRRDLSGAERMVKAG